MPITRSRNPLQTHLTVGGIPLEVIYSTKYLGVNISSDLTCREHISIMCKKKPRLTTQEVSPSQPPGPFETVLKCDFAQARVLQFCVGPPSSKIYLHVGECPEVWLYGHLQGMEFRLSNSTNSPSAANLTESQKTTKTHYGLQNSNEQIQYSTTPLHPSSFTLPPSPP